MCERGYSKAEAGERLAADGAPEERRVARIWSDPGCAAILRRVSEPPKSWQTYARQLHRDESTRHKAHKRRRRTGKIVTTAVVLVLITLFVVVLARTV